jgi:hypothetical protein
MNRTRAPLATLTVTELMTLLSSESATVGSGTAGCLAVALAASCAAKAVAISLRKHPDDRELQQCGERFCELADESVTRADEESRRFLQTLQSDSTTAKDKLLATERSLLSLAERLARLVEQIEPRIDRELQGDLLAATALRDAGAAILASNRDESLQC